MFLKKQHQLSDFASLNLVGAKTSYVQVFVVLAECNSNERIPFTLTTKRTHLAAEFTSKMVQSEQISVFSYH